jgi:hypothetical protein
MVLEMTTIRIQGLTRNYFLAFEGRTVILSAPNVLAKEWVIPQAQARWIGDEDPKADVVPAVAPRILPLITNRNYRLNFVLFFLTPQQVVRRTDKTIGVGATSVPFSLADSTEGVWADGVMVTVPKRERALAQLTADRIPSFGSLVEAVAATYGTWSQPRLDPSQMQVLRATQSGWVHTEPGDFWRHPQPVASNHQQR